MARGRKVLVVGSGGREHALALRLLESESVDEVIVAPGNAGTARTPAWLAPKTLRSATGAPAAIATREAVDLVVVGPEAPLCAGLVDDLSAVGRELAALEAALGRFPEPPVVKADGLCAGKGVVVADSHAEALEAARGMLTGASFGEAGKTVVLEERVLGAELSLHALVDGERFVMLPAAQDHKRLLDGDRGPNTGGMGTYAPAPLAEPTLLERSRVEIFERAVRGMAEEGAPFRGALFAGLMVTPAGELVLLEFNVRFGDPETQVLLATMGGDLADALDGAARGALDLTALAPNGDHALCVVLAAHGYPEDPRKGDAIHGLLAAETIPGVRVLHAGTALAGEQVVTAGGRVLGVCARGSSLAAAYGEAYRAIAHIRFEGMQFRRDIAGRALAPGLV